MKFSPSLGLMLTEEEIICKKSENAFFFKLKESGRMAKDNKHLKFERNTCNKVRDNRCHEGTDERRTTDEFRFHELC